MNLVGLVLLWWLLGAGGKLEISKRHMAVTKELLQEYPSLASYLDNSMSDRHKIVMEWIPKLSTEAAEAAIAEWGGPKSAITHIVMVSTSVVNMPGVDLLVANALGLDSSKLQRVMMYYAGCWGGGAALRIAKDLAENNKGARVLVVCADCTAVFFRAPSEEYLDGLVGQGLFGDGAAAVIVGADLHPEWEKPLFEIQWAGTAVVPDSLEAIAGYPMEAGTRPRILPLHQAHCFLHTVYNQKEVLLSCRST
jgi:chalcone synthase